MNQLEPDLLRHWPVEVKGGGGVNHIPAQFVPSVALREDVFGQALGGLTAVCFLNRFEYRVRHIRS